MRLRVAHEIVARFEPPATSVIRTALLTPRTYDGQYVGTWRIDVDRDCRLDRTFDPFGNVAHTFSLAGPIPSLSIMATGEVEVDDTAGVLAASAHERLPPGIFMRSTPLTAIDAAILDLAARCRTAGGETMLDRCHALKSILHHEINHRDVDPRAAVSTHARAATRRSRRRQTATRSTSPTSSSRCRAPSAPRRGSSAAIIWRDDRRDAGEAAHAWAESYVEGLGWVGFDPCNDCCPTDAYVRVSAGPDRLGACFLARRGDGGADGDGHQPRDGDAGGALDGSR